MTMEQMARMYTEYNHWANKRLLEHVLSLPGDFFTARADNSFDSIRKTFLHIWDAEYIWMARIEGKSFDTWPSALVNDDEPISALLETSLKWKDYSSSASVEELERKVDYGSIDGTPHSQKVFEILMHCMNHSTFHRGQVITMLRGFKVEGKIPSTDLITYLRSV
jgi:uncharacterized damage-inducible protein DinB